MQEIKGLFFRFFLFHRIQHEVEQLKWSTLLTTSSFNVVSVSPPTKANFCLQYFGRTCCHRNMKFVVRDFYSRH